MHIMENRALRAVPTDTGIGIVEVGDVGRLRLMVAVALLAFWSRGQPVYAVLDTWDPADLRMARVMVEMGAINTLACEGDTRFLYCSLAPHHNKEG